MKQDIYKNQKRSLFSKAMSSKWVLLRLSLVVIALSAAMFFLKGTEYLLLILLAALLHESGHIIFAKLFFVPLMKVRGGLFGVWLKYDFSQKSYLVQIIVSAAGAAFNVAASFAVFSLCPINTLSLFFIFSNLALAVFNLMPVSGFDGIGVLRCLLLTVLGDSWTADRICNGISTIFSGAFFILTVYIQMRVGISFSMVAVSVFLLYKCVGDRIFH